MTVLIPDRAYEIAFGQTTRVKTAFPLPESWAAVDYRPISKGDVMYGTLVVAAHSADHVFWIPDIGQYMIIPRGGDKAIKVFTSCGQREAVSI